MSQVVSEKADGTGRVYLSTLGYVDGLRWAHDYPGGPSRLDLNLHVPADYQHEALQAGRMVRVLAGGGTVWRGRMDAPERGEPWQVHAQGVGVLAGQAVAAATGTIDSVIDAAITRGLPITRPATLGAYTWAGTAGQDSIGQALNDVLDAVSKTWRVSAAGVISSETAPTAPSLLLRAVEAMPATLNDYATVVVARYQASTSAFATVTRTNAAAFAQRGWVEKPLDLTTLGVISAATANTYADAYLARLAPRLQVLGAFTAAQGDLLAPNGVPVDNALITAGVVVRVLAVTTIRDAFVTPGPVDVLIGQTDYDDDTGTLSLTPAGADRADLIGMLSKAVKK